MPVPSAIGDLSQTASANSPQGSEALGNNADNYLRAHASFIAILNAQKTPLNGTGATGTWPISVTGSAATWTTARSFTIGGTAKSVNGSAPVSWSIAEIFSASQTAKFVLAAPNAANGAPVFRALVASDVPTLNQSTTGNAATATALQTARTIGGVSFNGTANINLPGVNIAGNQSTTGNAATATALQTARTIAISGPVTGTATSFNGSAPITIPVTAMDVSHANVTGVLAPDHGGTGVNNATRTLTLGGNLTTAGAFATTLTVTGATNVTLPTTGTLATTSGTGATGTWGISITGNAATATALQTARTIGGVSFNGTANINLPGVNIAGNQNTTGNAATATVASTVTANVAATGSFPIPVMDGNTVKYSSVAAPQINLATGAISALGFVGPVTGNVSGSSGSTTGNAATATALQTARTIGGVSFNGTANINLPGVNIAGNQNTTGNAATATVASTITLVATNTTNATHFPVFVDAATGDENPRTDTGFTYNPSTGVLSSVSFNTTSDRRLKQNIQPIRSALSALADLRGCSFDIRDRSSFGFIAQDVQGTAFDNLVSANDEGMLSVNYSGFVAHIVEALKELKAELEDLKRRAR